LEIARDLISFGADVNAEDSDGRTPLSWAIRYRHNGLIGLLLTSSARVKGIMTNEWLDAYEKNAPKTVVSLSEGGGGKKFLRFIEVVSDHLLWMQAEPEKEKCLL